LKNKQLTRSVLSAWGRRSFFASFNSDYKQV